MLKSAPPTIARGPGTCIWREITLLPSPPIRLRLPPACTGRIFGPGLQRWAAGRHNQRHVLATQQACGMRQRPNVGQRCGLNTRGRTPEPLCRHCSSPKGPVPSAPLQAAGILDNQPRVPSPSWFAQTPTLPLPWCVLALLRVPEGARCLGGSRGSQYPHRMHVRRACLVCVRRLCLCLLSPP